MAASQPRTWTLTAAVVLFGITVLAYLPALSNGFIWDDDYYVTENTALRDLDGLSNIWFKFGTVPQYYPLTHTTFWVEYQLQRLAQSSSSVASDQHQVSPYSFHLVNILLHAANALLWWLLLCRLGVSAAVAWLAAAVFALHPVHVESVAWITERKNVLSGLMYLAAALAYLKFEPLDVDPHACTNGTRRWGWWAVALVLYLLALLSKSVAATLPAAMLLVVYWRTGSIQWRRVWPTLPLFVVGLGMGLVTLYMESETVHASGPEWAFSPFDRLLIAGRALWFYVGTLAWPANLTFSYRRWQIDDTAAWQYAYPAAALVVIAVLWFLRRRIGRGPLVGVLFFAGTLVPALGFFNVFPMLYSFVADHFQYLASMGMIGLIVVAAGSAVATQSPARRRIGVAAALLVLGLLGTATWRQTHMYKDLRTLWTQTIKRNPESWMAYNNLGIWYVAGGQDDRAEPLFRNAIKLNPANVDALCNLAQLLVRADQIDAAIEWYRIALTKPRGRATTHADLAVAMRLKGDFTAAVHHFEQAVAFRPTDMKMANSLIEAYGLSAEAHYKRGDMAGVVEAFGRSLRLRPDQVTVLRSLTWILATSPDAAIRNGAEAVGYAERANALTGGKDPRDLNGLAAAYAEVGRFDDADAAISAAIKLAEQAGQHDAAQRWRKRREGYREHRSLRAP